MFPISAIIKVGFVSDITKELKLNACFTFCANPTNRCFESTRGIKDISSDNLKFNSSKEEKVDEIFDKEQLQNDNYKNFKKIMGDLANCSKHGYTIYADNYKFEEYGIPQTRHRIILVGFRSNFFTENNILEREAQTLTTNRAASRSTSSIQIPRFRISSGPWVLLTGTTPGRCPPLWWHGWKSLCDNA